MPCGGPNIFADWLPSGQEGPRLIPLHFWNVGSCVAHPLIDVLPHFLSSDN
jgi:hypothetical protein